MSVFEKQITGRIGVHRYKQIIKGSKMSERCKNKLIVIAHSEEAEQQLRSLLDKAIANWKHNSFFTTQRNPNDLNNAEGGNQDYGSAIIQSLNGYTSNLQGVFSEFWGKPEIQMLQIDKKILKIEFFTLYAPCFEVLVKMSQDYPDLFFYNTYNINEWESVIEVQNGEIFNHYGVPSFPEDIKSNSLVDYRKNSVLHPVDENGNGYPFTLKVINHHKVVARYFKHVNLINTSERCFADAFIHNLIRYRETNNLGISCNLSKDEFTECITYSRSFIVTKISDAIESSVVFMNELNNPIIEIINKVTDLDLILAVPEINKPKVSLFH